MRNAPGCKTKCPGDPVELGDMVGHGQEPNLIVGRVVGIFKGRKMRVAYRTYRNQEEPYPTGHVRIGMSIYPHMHFGDGSCSRMIFEEEK